MAKNRKTTRKRKTPVRQTPQHSLPDGFWAQVGAVLLIVVSILFVVAWFGAGGPVLDWLYRTALQTIGYGVYILPFIMVYLAIDVFRSEENRTPAVIKATLISEIIWVSALFGLYKNASGQTNGGMVGDLINSGVLMLVYPSIATFIYILIIAISILFIFSVSPIAVVKKIWEVSHQEASTDEPNVRVVRRAAKANTPKSSIINNFKLNAGVPTLDPAEEVPEKKRSKLSSLKGSVAQDKVAEEKAALVTVKDSNWRAPSIDLLEQKQAPADAGDVQQNAKIIQDTLSEFNIDVQMEGANIGPKVTQYTLRPPSGVKLTKITALETNIALNLAAQSLRIEAPIPGQKAVGIEVPNRKAADVRIYSVLTSKQWKNSHEPLSFAIGKDISGEAVVGELNKMPHLLIAGQTGSGKSVMINTLLTSLLYRNSPSEMKLILVDPKQVEMAPYEDIPHLLTPVISEPDKTISALKWAVNEMERRYSLLAEHKIKDIKTYNNMIQSSSRKRIAIEDEEGHAHEHENGAMPYIVIVIDELADLMMVAARDVEALIVRLAQKARAVGIHLVLATQRPSVDVITGLIKANVPARIAFTVASQVDSRTILDQIGAEKLLGQGDMLISTPSMSKPKRIQGAWVTDEEVTKITNHLQLQSPPQYNNEVVSQPVQLNGKGGVVMDFSGGENEDSMYRDAVKVVIDSGKASASLLQRRLRVGYARAARLIETMEDQGLIGPADGQRPREVLISDISELGGGDSAL